MGNVYIAGAARTAMGGFQGVFSGLDAATLGGAAIRAAVEQAGVGGQGRDATARCIGQNIDQPRGIGQRQRGAGALDLGGHMA